MILLYVFFSRIITNFEHKAGEKTRLETVEQFCPFQVSKSKLSQYILKFFPNTIKERLFIDGKKRTVFTNLTVVSTVYPYPDHSYVKHGGPLESKEQNNTDMSDGSMLPNCKSSQSTNVTVEDVKKLLTKHNYINTSSNCENVSAILPTGLSFDGFTILKEISITVNNKIKVDSIKCGNSKIDFEKIFGKVGVASLPELEVLLIEFKNARVCRGSQIKDCAK